MVYGYNFGILWPNFMVRGVNWVMLVKAQEKSLTIKSLKFEKKKPNTKSEKEVWHVKTV